MGKKLQTSPVNVLIGNQEVQLEACRQAHTAVYIVYYYTLWLQVTA